jgi:hypothetical protein
MIPIANWARNSSQSRHRRAGSSKPDSAIAIQELRSGPGLKTLERYVGTATDAGSAQVQNHRAVQKAYER